MKCRCLPSKKITLETWLEITLCVRRGQDIVGSHWKNLAPETTLERALYAGRVQNIVISHRGNFPLKTWLESASCVGKGRDVVVSHRKNLALQVTLESILHVGGLRHRCLPSKILRARGMLECASYVGEVESLSPVEKALHST